MYKNFIIFLEQIVTLKLFFLHGSPKIFFINVGIQKYYKKSLFMHFPSTVHVL